MYKTQFPNPKGFKEQKKEQKEVEDCIYEPCSRKGLRERENLFYESCTYIFIIVVLFPSTC